MKIYEENTDKFIEKIKTKGLQYLTKLSKNYASGIVGTIITGAASVAIPNLMGAKSSDPNCWKENQENYGNINDNYYDDYDLPSVDDEYSDDAFQENFLDKNNLEELSQNIFDSNLFISAYVIASFLNLGWNVYEFYKAHKDLETVNKNVQIFKDKLIKIKSDFNEHKENIGILPDDPKESLEKIIEVFKLIFQDFNELEKLMKEIIENIQIAKKHKNKSILGLIGSGILGIAGITGGILMKNPKPIGYGIGVISNIFSAIGHSSIIIESKKLIKDLERILNDALIQRQKILDEIENIVKVLSNMEKGQLPKFQEQ